MVSVFAFNEGEGGDEDMELGEPDESEVKDHARHVARCALRFRLLRRTQRRQGRSISRMEIAIYILIAVSVLSSPAAAKLFGILS